MLFAVHQDTKIISRTLCRHSIKSVRLPRKKSSIFIHLVKEEMFTASPAHIGPIHGLQPRREFHLRQKISCCGYTVTMSSNAYRARKWLNKSLSLWLVVWLKLLFFAVLNLMMKAVRSFVRMGYNDTASHLRRSESSLLRRSRWCDKLCCGCIYTLLC
jgi:hypothetical protein